MLPSRLLVIMEDHWPRAGLRAELRELGYDAIGARSCVEAMTYPAAEPGRGPVRLLIVDQDAVERDGLELLHRLRSVHYDPPVILLAHVTRDIPAGPWTVVLRRPLAIGAVAAAVQAPLPLPPSIAIPIDE